MIQFKVLSGKHAGTTWAVWRFPVCIGRSKLADLQLEESGVWDQHLQLEFSPTEGILLKSQPDALTTVNGQAIRQTVLRNGDAIGLGSLSMQFWLSQTHQVGLRFREGLTWVAIAAISLGQIGLIYCLLR
jgi:hypothetical protein